MKIGIENYYGGDVLVLDFKGKLFQPDEATMNTIESIANNHGFNIADIEDNTIRIQQEEIEFDEKSEHNNYLLLINELTTYLL